MLIASKSMTNMSDVQYIIRLFFLYELVYLEGTIMTVWEKVILIFQP